VGTDPVGRSWSAARASSIVSNVRAVVPSLHLIAYSVPSSMDRSNPASGQPYRRAESACAENIAGLRPLL